MPLGAEIILAETADRFVRSMLYHSQEQPNSQADEMELEPVRWLSEKITLMTDLHPDASPKEVRSYQRKRGQRFKDSYGGRPRKVLEKEPGYMNQRRNEKLQRVLDLAKQGHSDREISAITGVPRTTIRRWLVQRL